MINTTEAVNLLEKKLKNLLSNYDFLLKENQLLLQNTSKLHHELLENKQLLEQREKEFKLLCIPPLVLLFLFISSFPQFQRNRGG